jgi:hypothetical protein
VLADKAFAGGSIRRLIEERGAFPSIPPKANRPWKAASPGCFTEAETPSN